MASLAIVMAAFLGGCAAPSAHFVIDSPGPEFHVVSDVSILGVYRNGILDATLWESFAVQFQPSVGSSRCEIGYGSSLARRNADVFKVISEEAELSDGTLLKSLIPAAQSPYILAIEIYGRSSPEMGVNKSSHRTLLAHGGGGGGDMMPSPQGPAAPPAPRAELEIVATLFSSQTRSVHTRLTMHYSDGEEEDAFRQFGDRLASTFPALRCGRWDWTKVKAARVFDSAGIPSRRVEIVPR